MIQINNLAFSYGKKGPLFNGLNLAVRGGKIYGLLGKNGAGKTTLLKNMCGLLFPLQGTITINGSEPRKRLPSFLRNIYLVPEEVYVPSITIKSYLKIFSPFYPRFSSEQFSHYLSVLEIPSTGKLSTFSFGEQKKFIIAFALACNTQVLLMDEPTNGLDIPSKANFRKLIASILNEDRIILISTHQVRDLDNLIDGVIIIDNGQVLLNAAVTDITQKLCFKTAREFPEGVEILYSEASLHGLSVVMKNKTNEDTRVNLEQLFQTVTNNTDVITNLFKN